MGGIERTYASRRDNIVRKSAELSVLCDTNVGLLMFSPTGELTSYASKGRVEDVFLRYIENHEIKDGDIEEKETLSQGLKHTKCEAEMLDIIEKIQALEEQLIKLDKRKIELQEKLRYYDPAVENISSVEEAELHDQLLRNALQRVDEKILKALRKDDFSKNCASNKDKGPSVESHHEAMAEGLMASRANGNLDSFVYGSSSGQHSNHWGGECLRVPHGPHLNIGFLNSQTNWNL